jgi:hypothetical protein
LESAVETRPDCEVFCDPVVARFVEITAEFDVTPERATESVVPPPAVTTDAIALDTAAESTDACEFAADMPVDVDVTPDCAVEFSTLTLRALLSAVLVLTDTERALLSAVAPTVEALPAAESAVLVSSDTLTALESAVEAAATAVETFALCDVFCEPVVTRFVLAMADALTALLSAVLTLADCEVF